MFMRTFIFIIATIVVLCIISWRLTLVTLAAVIPISFTAVFYGRWVRVKSEEVQARKGELGIISEEAISNIRTVKAFSTET